MQKSQNHDNFAFAVRYKNDIIRKNSSSGAYFQCVARHFIDNGGYVCGCVLEDMKVVHIVSNNVDDITRMAGSKYVQSDMKNCFAEIGKILQDEISVLFSGTSCQTAGLKMYLSNKNIDMNKLLTIDFFCHGVPSPLIFKEYLNNYEKRRNRKPIDYKFRCKDYGWGKASRGSNYFNTILRSTYARAWRRIFFSDLVLRKKCHDCNYCTAYKPADITMGDFWGIEELLPNFNDGMGISVVIIHNRENVKYVTELLDLEYFETDLNDAIKCQYNAFYPSKQNELREKFWHDYFENGFDFAFKKYIYTKSFVIKQKIKMLLFLLRLRNYNG